MPPIAELEAIRKAQIMEAALATIASRGSANVTMEEIAVAAGLSKGGLAHYYKSKKELFLAAFQFFFDRIFQRSKETMASFDDPIDQLMSFNWLYNLDDEDLHIGYPILFDAMSMVVRDEDFRRIFHDWINNWVVLLGGAIQEGLQRGQFKEMDVKGTARAISGIYQGLCTRWYLDPEAHSSRWAVDSYRLAIKGLIKPYLAD